MTLAPGDIVEIPFPNGKHARIWVIAVDEDGISFLVMKDDAPATGNAGPALPDDDAEKKGWFRGRIPADFAVVATKKPTAAAKKLVANVTGTMIYATAKRLRDSLFLTWRWKPSIVLVV